MATEHLQPYVSKEELEAALQDIEQVSLNLNLHESFKQADRITRSATLLLDCALERDIRHRYDETSLFYYFWLVDPTWRMGIFVAAFSYMILLPFFEAPCRAYDAMNVTPDALRTCSTDHLCAGVEIVLILPIIWTDIILRYRATGTRAFFDSKWNIAMLLSLVCCSVDAIGALAFPYPKWPHPRTLRLFRSVLALSSSKHTREAASDGIWVIANMAGYVIGILIFTCTWAALGLAIIGNLGARVTTDNFPNSYGAFNAIMTLITSNNYPDVQLPYLRLSPWFQIYFFVIVSIGYYFWILGVIPGLVGNFYHLCLLDEAKHQFSLERNVLLVVFGGIQEEGKMSTTLNQDQLLKVYLELARLWQQGRWLQKILKKVQPSRRDTASDRKALTESAMRIYSGIDKDGGGSVDVKEFVDFARDATDQEILRNFEAPPEVVDLLGSYPMRMSVRGIASSPFFMIASAVLAAVATAIQFQILELILVLQVPFGGQLKDFWYMDWTLLALAGVEFGISRFSRFSVNKIEYFVVAAAFTAKLIGHTIVVGHGYSTVPLYPFVRSTGYAHWLRLCLMVRALGILQIFGVVPHSLKTIGLFTLISKDMGRLISCILALMALFCNIGQRAFLGSCSKDNPNLAGSNYATAGYYDFVNFDSWLSGLNTVFYIQIDNNWSVAADGHSLASGYNTAWIFFILIYFLFGSLIMNIFLCMFMELYASVEKEKKAGGPPVVSSMSVTHRMIRNEVRDEYGIKD